MTTDDLDALWPDWMSQKRNEIRAERKKRTASAEKADDAARECSTAELERQRAQERFRKEGR